MDLAIVEKRFRENTQLRWKEGSNTPKEYAHEFFDCFAVHASLPKYTRRQLVSSGKALLAKYIKEQKEASRRWVISALKLVWEEGLNLTWPLNRSDIGRLPRPGRGGTPRDEVIHRWDEAYQKETDPYLKAAVVTALSYGWRNGNQMGKLRRDRHVLYRDGKPVGIYAVRANFKTGSPIVAWLVPEVAGVWETMWSVYPESPYIFVWRDRKGLDCRDAQCENKHVDPLRPMTATDFQSLFEMFEQKWKLPHLTSKDTRHWVKSALRRLGMQQGPAKAAWQGHDPTEEFPEAPMDAQYDNPVADDIYAEQSRILPSGPLVLVRKVEVGSGVRALPQTIVDACWGFLDNTLDSSDVVDALKAAKKVHAQQNLTKP